MLRKIFIHGLLFLVVVLSVSIPISGWCRGAIPLKILCDDIYTIPSATPFEYETSGTINEFKIYDENSNVINAYKLKFILFGHESVIKDLFLEYDENMEPSQYIYKNVKEPTYYGVGFELLDMDDKIIESLEIDCDEKENKVARYISDNFALVIKFEGNSWAWFKEYGSRAILGRYKDSSGREIPVSEIMHLFTNRFEGPVDFKILSLQGPSRKILEDKIKELGFKIE